GWGSGLAWWGGRGLRFFLKFSPPIFSFWDAMGMFMSEQVSALFMAVAISWLKEWGAAPPMRISKGISGSSKPWKATAWVKPREMIELRRGEFASWMSVEGMGQRAKAASPLKRLHRHKLTPLAASRRATRTAW